MTKKMASLPVIYLIKVFGNRLMVDVREHAVHDTRLRIIGITGLVGFQMMNMMRDYIYFFCKSAQDEVLCNKSPEWMTECIRSMCAIAMKPNCAMSTHHNHSVNSCNYYQGPSDIMGQKKIGERHEKYYYKPVNEWNPIFF